MRDAFFFTLQHPCCCTVKTAVPQLFMDLTVSITGKINSREIELESGVLFADKIVWRFPFGFALAKENHICVISRFLCYRTVWRSRVNRVRRRDMLINQIPPSLASIRFTAQAQLKYQFRMGRRVAQNPPSIRRASAEHPPSISTSEESWISEWNRKVSTRKGCRNATPIAKSGQRGARSEEWRMRRSNGTANWSWNRFFTLENGEIDLDNDIWSIGAQESSMHLDRLKNIKNVHVRLDDWYFPIKTTKILPEESWRI